MPNTRWTPGPWRFNGELSKHATRLVFGPDGFLVADAGRIFRRNNDESEANAHLIAAAPDLYAALASFPGFTNDATVGDQWIESMRAALAKARGE